MLDKNLIPDNVKFPVVLLENVTTKDPERMVQTCAIHVYKYVMDKEQFPSHYRNVRKYKNSNDPEGQKMWMLAISPNVEEYDGAGTGYKNIVKRSNLMVVDIDDVSKIGDVDEVKLKLEAEYGAHCVVIVKSISENGIHMIVVIDNPEQYEDHWDEFAADIKLKIGIFPDPNASDVGRKLFLGYDEDVICNENATPIPLKSKKKKATSVSTTVQKESLPKQTASTPESKDEINTDVSNAVEINLNTMKEIERCLNKSGHEFTEGNRNDFVFRFATFTNNHGISLEEVHNYLQDMHEINAYNKHLQRLFTYYRDNEATFGKEKFVVHTQSAQKDNELTEQQKFITKLYNTVIDLIQEEYNLIPKK